jgi:acetyltransferase
MPGSYELLLGLADDPTFGPVVLFGRGGTAAELVGDRPSRSRPSIIRWRAN